jgi:hypothetical protein
MKRSDMFSRHIAHDERAESRRDAFVPQSPILAPLPLRLDVLEIIGAELTHRRRNPSRFSLRGWIDSLRDVSEMTLCDVARLVDRERAVRAIAMRRSLSLRPPSGRN